MDKEVDVLFLYAIAEELKHSYECPVILLTQKDYAENIHDTIVKMRSALVQKESTEKIIEIVKTFHFEWLEAVHDVEILKKRAKETPRETIINSVDYTIKCLKNRQRPFQQYLAHISDLLAPNEKSILDAELEIIRDMRHIEKFALLEKQNNLSNAADKTDFTTLVFDEIEELFNWIDRLNDYLAIQLCNLLELGELPSELSLTLQEEINLFACYSSSAAMKVTEALTRKRTLSSARPITSSFKEHDISKIVEKISKLEDQIARMKNKKSASDNILAQQHKTIFLKDRLESLENLNVSLSVLQQTNVEEGDVRIFNHLLPQHERSLLVEKLVKQWEAAMINPAVKSLTSDMRTAEIKKDFCDGLGTFTVDEHGRKIYRKKDEPTLYQVDNTNQLVPVNDDEHHVYFYDGCGRYYLNDGRIRVYKAHSVASEYILHSSGVLLKLAETVHGIKYHYDSLGRYHIKEYGDRIYHEQGSTEKYRRDDLGNLVKIRDYEDSDFVDCPVEPMVTKESLYLKEVVGDALRSCVADVILALPVDPVKYLAERLEKYYIVRKNRQKTILEESLLNKKRERLKAFVRRESSQSSTLSEGSCNDNNFMSYYE